jgi:hypothetical protein
MNIGGARDLSYERISARRRNGSLTPTAALPLGGFFAGMLTVSALYPAGQLGIELLVGAVFGGLLALTLAWCGFVQRLWSAIRLVIVATVSYVLAVLMAFGSQLALLPLLPTSQQWSMGSELRDSPIALFLGGLAGAFLVLAEVLPLVRPQVGTRTVVVTAGRWSIAGGVFAVIGWVLGPSLGTTLWALLHATGLLPKGMSAHDQLYGYGEASLLYSLHLVWQTGMTFLIGLLLRDYTPLLGPQGSSV